MAATGPGEIIVPLQIFPVVKSRWKIADRRDPRNGKRGHTFNRRSYLAALQSRLLKNRETIDRSRIAEVHIGVTDPEFV